MEMRKERARARFIMEPDLSALCGSSLSAFCYARFGVCVYRPPSLIPRKGRAAETASKIKEKYLNSIIHLHAMAIRPNRPVRRFVCDRQRRPPRCLYVRTWICWGRARGRWVGRLAARSNRLTGPCCRSSCTPTRHCVWRNQNGRIMLMNTQRRQSKVETMERLFFLPGDASPVLHAVAAHRVVLFVVQVDVILLAAGHRH